MAKRNTDDYPETRRSIEFWTGQCDSMWDDMVTASHPLHYLHGKIDATKYRRSLFTRMMAAGLFPVYHFRDHYMKRSHETHRMDRNPLPLPYRKVPDMTWEQYWDWLNGTPEFHGMLWRICIAMQSIVHEHMRNQTLGGYNVMIARLRLALSYAMGPCPQLEVIGTDPNTMTIVVAGNPSTVLVHMSGIYQEHLMHLMATQNGNTYDEC